MYGYVKNSPTTLTDPFGLKVEIGESVVIGNEYRTVIVITPDSGGPTMTLSAHPDYQPIIGSSIFGKLVATRNLPSELSGNLANLTQVTDPLGRSDADFIKAVIMASQRYNNALLYDPVPADLNNYYNSNSYVSGVLKGAGVPNPPTLPGKQPGYDKPIPLTNK